MLIASALFKEDGTLLQSQIPNIVVGDKESVKLEVSFYEDYDNLKLLDLSNYVVEAIFERPDAKVSPALLLGIDLNNFNKKYLIFGGWLTEVAGISKITVRIKQNGTIKATGLLSLTIHDGNVPADVVITEPQFESLQNAIQAEENARIADYRKAQTEREIGDGQLNEKIDEVDERLQGNIDYESYERKENEQLIYGEINKKLNKNLSDLSIVSNVSISDYVLVNIGGVSYRITFGKFRDIISLKTDYFKGYFPTAEELPIAGEPGDYAFVGLPETEFKMVIWDDEEKSWEMTTHSEYVDFATFNALQESLKNGSFELDSVTELKDQVVNLEDKTKVVEKSGDVPLKVGDILPKYLPFFGDYSTKGYVIGEAGPDGNVAGVLFYTPDQKYTLGGGAPINYYYTVESNGIRQINNIDLVVIDIITDGFGGLNITRYQQPKEITVQELYNKMTRSPNLICRILTAFDDFYGGSPTHVTIGDDFSVSDIYPSSFALLNPKPESTYLFKFGLVVDNEFHGFEEIFSVRTLTDYSYTSLSRAVVSEEADPIIIFAWYGEGKFLFEFAYLLEWADMVFGTGVDIVIEAYEL